MHFSKFIRRVALPKYIFFKNYEEELLVATIFLSVKPKYIEKIFNGTKKYEFRKKLAKLDVSKIILYSTSPCKLVVGEVEVTGTLSKKPSQMWQDTKKYAGITKKGFDDYYKNSLYAYAYKLGDTLKYQTPKNLSELGIERAPQSFIYLLYD